MKGQQGERDGKIKEMMKEDIMIDRKRKTIDKKHRKKETEGKGKMAIKGARLINVGK